jgi:uncharacterized protein (DUF2062 family)
LIPALKALLLNPQESDHRKAVSVGFGIFMGIVPLWGFQLAIGIPLAFLFKMNKALFILAANISVPPMIPIILFLSHQTGKLWMGTAATTILFSRQITLATIQSNFLQYACGAVTLAILAGSIVGLSTFFALKLFRKPMPGRLS